MVEVLTLAYKRVPGDLSSGLITLEKAEFSGVLLRFDDVDWTKVITYLAEKVKQYPNAEVRMCRLDRPGLLPMRLSDDFLELLKTDPVRAIRATSIPPQVVKTGLREEMVNMMEPIPAGYDTMISSFGELVLVRCRLDRGNCPVLECPLTGNWVPLETCGFHIEWYRAGRGWAALKTEEVLARPAQRYFFPRPWNHNPPWITRSDLERMYNEYKQEKEKASCTLSDVK